MHQNQDTRTEQKGVCMCSSNRQLDVMQAVQKEREEKLAGKLKDFLNQYVRGDTKGFLQRAESEAKRLANAGNRLIVRAGQA